MSSKSVWNNNFSKATENFCKIEKVLEIVLKSHPVLKESFLLQKFSTAKENWNYDFNNSALILLLKFYSSNLNVKLTYGSYLPMV